MNNDGWLRFLSCFNVFAWMLWAYCDVVWPQDRKMTWKEWLRFKPWPWSKP